MCIASISPFSVSAEAASCHINTPYAIGCTSPDVAVQAYQRFRGDPRAVGTSNVRALLQQAQCLVPGPDYRTVNIRLFNEGRVPTSTEWVNVMYVDYRDGYLPLYFAKAYISGNCQTYKEAPPCYGHMDGSRFIDDCPRLR